MDSYQESPLLAAELRKQNRMLAVARIRARIAEDKYGGGVEQVRKRRRRAVPQIIDAADIAILGLNRQPERREPETLRQAQYTLDDGPEDPGPQSPLSDRIAHHLGGRRRAEDTLAFSRSLEQLAASAEAACDDADDVVATVRSRMRLSQLPYLVAAAWLALIVVALRRVCCRFLEALVLPAVCIFGSFSRWEVLQLAADLSAVFIVLLGLLAVYATRAGSYQRARA
ncbi:hypothetical protein RB595_009541 [Gaeumannomyces hyphopodioides]